MIEKLTKEQEKLLLQVKQGRYDAYVQREYDPHRRKKS